MSDTEKDELIKKLTREIFELRVDFASVSLIYPTARQHISEKLKKSEVRVGWVDPLTMKLKRATKTK